MTDYPEGTTSPASKELQEQAKLLQDAVRKAVLTSPDSFFKTVADVDAKAQDYWVGEIRSSTWVVAEQDGHAVGVAASKLPDRSKDKEDPRNSRYIESVWIAPNLRGHRLGERLITYLMTAELRKNPNVKQFVLWVFASNSSAINLYKYMNFYQTEESQEGPDFRTEIKYRLETNLETCAAVWETADKDTLSGSKLKYGVTYRVIGEGDSA